MSRRAARGLLDVATGRYPSFVFGGGVGRCLPVFHFHEARRADLEPYLLYLAENDYRTVTTAAIEAFVLRGVAPGPRAVVLCFDDAWASAWTVVNPLLRRYDLHAITFAIPGRVADAAGTRPTLEQDEAAAESVDRSEIPFATWPELIAMSRDGRFDVQSHSLTHSRIFCGSRRIGFVAPEFLRGARLDRPLASGRDRAEHLGESDLGAPLYRHASRMSDRRRYIEDSDIREACIDHVRRRGGAEFFSRDGWQGELAALADRAVGRFETGAEQTAAWRRELEQARSILDDRLGEDRTRQICFPWGIAGRKAIELAAAAGYRTAFADRLGGFRAVRPMRDPFRLMRLPYRYIFTLPGAGRRSFLAVQSARAD